MSFVAQFWLPVLLSAVLVFVLSAASHMALPWRRGEWGRITEAGPLQEALRGLKPGLHAFPAAPDPKQQMSPEWMERWSKGPSGWLTLAPPGPMRMGRNMRLSFVVFAAVGLVDAAVAYGALGPAAGGGAVFWTVAPIAFLAFAAGPVFTSIWYHRPWRAYLSDAIDALLFAAVMGAVFGWLWPR